MWVHVAVDGLGEGAVIGEQCAPVALDEWLEVAGCVVSTEELLVKHAVTTFRGVQRVAGEPEGAPPPTGPPASHCSSDAPMPRSEALAQNARIGGHLSTPLLRKLGSNQRRGERDREVGLPQG